MIRIKRVQRIVRQDSAEADREVGYGKPPKRHRFRPGQSGNPRGRPKGSKNSATLLRKILDRKIEVRTSGRSRKIIVLEAIITRIAENALKGDVKAAAFLLQRYDGQAEADGQADVTTMEEQEILAGYADALLNRRGKK